MITYSNTISLERKNQNSGAINIYPNPAHDWIQIEFSSYETIASLKLVDVTGKIQMEQNLESKPGGLSSVNINISALPTGVYYLMITGDKGHIEHGVEKIFKH